MRRLDIEEVLGEIEYPDTMGCEYLLEILWQVGPVRHEAPLYEQDLQPWERRRGIELEPWEAELILDMSKAYLGEMYAAREWSAPCPWTVGQKMWKYVTDELSRPSETKENVK